MQRTGTARRAGGVVGALAFLMVCLVLSGFGTAAGATGGPTDPVTASPSSTSSPAGRTGSETLGTVSAKDDKGSQRTVTVAYYKVLTNDTCASVTPCTVANMTAPMTITDHPAGWGATVTSAGEIRVGIPPNTVMGDYTIRYAITDGSGTVHGNLVLSVYLPPTPDHYNPPMGSRFSHAFERGAVYRIHKHVLRTINSVPHGGQIRVLTWSFHSNDYAKALADAKRRGVSVQIILAGRNTASNSDLTRLQKVFGGNRFGKNADTGSWVYRCTLSCRGTKGTMHAKVFLFSQSYNTRWVVMSGSGNLTDFAANGQWNQVFTNTNSKPLYDAVLGVFAQDKLDRPAHPQQLTLTFPNTTYYFTPLTSKSSTYDFVYHALQDVKCTGTAQNGGKTKIRISMYTWRDSRGDWMARAVRKLWNQGCDVRIVYAIMGNRIKAILYSPSGRGRIPMRQTILVDAKHQPVWYLHEKYVAIAGNILGNPNAYEVFQGSFNFSDLGVDSDENTQKINGYAYYAPYLQDFNQIWVQPETRAPDPNSYVLPEERLGAGRYQFMEPN